MLTSLLYCYRYRSSYRTGQWWSRRFSS